jgi:hypothetical protein
MLTLDLFSHLTLILAAIRTNAEGKWHDFDIKDRYGRNIHGED